MGGPSRPPEEEWDPEYTPKSRKYFQVWLLALISDTRAPLNFTLKALVVGCFACHSDSLFLYKCAILGQNKLHGGQ